MCSIYSKSSNLVVVSFLVVSFFFWFRDRLSAFAHQGSQTSSSSAAAASSFGPIQSFESDSMDLENDVLDNSGRDRLKPEEYYSKMMVHQNFFNGKHSQAKATF
jgi:hypothetical protein